MKGRIERLFNYMEFVVSLFFYAYKEKGFASHNTEAVGKIVFDFD